VATQCGRPLCFRHSGASCPKRGKSCFKFDFAIRALADCRRACAGADLVLHHAALGSVPRSIEDPLACHEANVTGFVNMLVAARDAGVSRFCLRGVPLHLRRPSRAAQGGRGDRHAAPAVRRANEFYADVFARCYGLTSIGLRYFNIFGPRQDPVGGYAAVIPKWIRPVHRQRAGVHKR